MEVSKVATPQPVEAVAQALSSAWARRFGEPAPATVLALLLGLADLETNTFGTVNGKGFYNYNLGNIVAPYPDTQVWFAALDSGNPRKFRAWNSLDAGAEGFVKQLTSDTRKEWHAGLLTGDPEKFVRALNGQNGGPHYFEANFDQYLAGYKARWGRYAGHGMPAPEGTTLPKAEPPKGGPSLTKVAAWGVGLWLLARLVA